MVKSDLNSIKGEECREMLKGGGDHSCEDSKKQVKHINWDSHVEFVLSCVGYAVGLGNIWRFPYLCMQNGGGAFLIPYFISLLFCGVPLFFLEVCLGQFSGLSPLELWRLCPLFKGLGYGMVIVSGIICIYYNVVIAWVLLYLIKAMTHTLPWSSCSNDWNTANCSVFSHHSNTTPNAGVFLNVSDGFNASRSLRAAGGNGSGEWNSPAEEFWRNEVLEISSGIGDIGGIKWDLFGCFMFSWLVVYICLSKGVKSSGKVVYVTATAPYVLLTVLMIRGTTLPGALDGIKFYIVPDFSKLLSFRVWAVALLQVFYSLGPAWGGLIAMSSYNKFSNNCVRDGILVPLINGGTSFYGGFVIFSVIGFISHKTGRSVDQFIQSGPGLAFIAYPEALAELPISPLWAIFFFVMLFTLGLDSQFATFETVTSSFFDMIPGRLRRHQFLWTALLCLIEAAIGTICVTKAGIYFFQIMDWYAAAFSVMLIAFLECIALAWVYGHRQLYYDISMMLGREPSVFWKVCWCFITPLMLLVSISYSVFVMKEPVLGDYHYPRWAIAFGWTLAMTSIAPIPVCFCKALLQHKGSLLQRLYLASRPLPSWGPASDQHKAVYESVKQKVSLTELL